MSGHRPYSSCSSSHQNSPTRAKRLEAWKADRNPDQAIQSLIPKWALELNLGTRALTVLGLVHALASRHGSASSRNATLAAKIGCSETTISRAITECQRKGGILPVYLTKADGSHTRRLLTCCRASAQFLAGLTEDDWRNLAFSPLAGADRAGVLDGAQNFTERCEMYAACHLGRLRLALHMEVGTEEIIVDLCKKSPARADVFQASDCLAPLIKDAHICIHSDFQSEENKEPNAAGGVGSLQLPLPNPQAQPIPPLPVASPQPSAEHPAPTPHVAPTPLPAAKKRGGGQFEADHPGVMARIRALCEGDTDASWDATYTRAVQAFAKSWDAQHGPSEKALRLLEAHLPAEHRKKLTLASLAYGQIFQDKLGVSTRGFWAAQIYVASSKVEEAWSDLDQRFSMFRGGPLKGGQDIRDLVNSNHGYFADVLEKYDNYAALVEGANCEDISFVRACVTLVNTFQLPRLWALHARYAGNLEQLIMRDWAFLLPVIANASSAELTEALGIDAARLLDLVHEKYAELRASVVSNYKHAWVAFDERASKYLIKEHYEHPIEFFDERMQSVVPCD